MVGKRIIIQQIDKPSIADKKFRRVLPGVQRRVQVVPALLVVEDLRRGSLASLDRYLQQPHSKLDRQVALALRMLISGTHCRTNYRMILIPHPDAPKNKGGAPKKKSAKATALQHSIVNDFAAELSKANGEVESAVKALEKKHGVSRAAVFRARKAVEAENIAIGQREAMKRESDRWHNEFELRHRRAMEKLKADVSQKT